MRLADFAITQFFFKVEEYRRLRDEMAALGMNKPILAGIMPITSLVSVQRMAQLSGYVVPDDIVRRIEAGGEDRAEVRKRGIEVATELCRDLLEAGRAGAALLYAQLLQGHARDLREPRVGRAALDVHDAPWRSRRGAARAGRPARDRQRRATPPGHQGHGDGPGRTLIDSKALFGASYVLLLPAVGGS